MPRIIKVNLTGIEKEIELKLAVGEYRQKAKEAQKVISDKTASEQTKEATMRQLISDLSNLSLQEVEDNLTEMELQDLFLSALGDQDSLTRVIKFSKSI